MTILCWQMVHFLSSKMMNNTFAQSAARFVGYAIFWSSKYLSFPVHGNVSCFLFCGCGFYFVVVIYIISVFCSDLFIISSFVFLLVVFWGFLRYAFAVLLFVAVIALQGHHKNWT